MNLFGKTLIKFCIAFGIFFFGQLLCFQLIFKNFIDVDIDENISILILGDSQLRTDLNDSIIEKSINLCNGADVTFFSYVKLKRIKETNPHIDTLILGFNWENLYSNDFYHTTVMQARFGDYFYLMDLNDFNELISENFEVFLRGTSGMIKNFRKIPLVFKSNDIRNLELGGYLPRPNNISELETSIDKEANKEAKFQYMDHISQMELNHFLKIVTFCKENKIKLIVINGPMHTGISKIRKQEKANFIVTLNNIEEDFDYWDYEDLKLADSLFYDYSHLKGKGANIFSKMINNRLINSLSKSGN